MYSQLDVGMEVGESSPRDSGQLSEFHWASVQCASSQLLPATTAVCCACVCCACLHTHTRYAWVCSILLTHTHTDTHTLACVLAHTHTHVCIYGCWCACSVEPLWRSEAEELFFPSPSWVGPGEKTQMVRLDASTFIHQDTSPALSFILFSGSCSCLHHEICI